MTMSVGGLVSGMDTSTLVSQLVQAERAPQKALEARLKSTQDHASAYRTVNTTFLAVTAAAEAALKPESWSPVKVSSSATSVTASATTGASSGSLTFTVKQLAASHAVMEKNATPGAWTTATSLYGAASITVADENGTPLAPITVKAGGTLADAAAAINASPHGLTASVVQVNGGEARLRIAAKDTGLASRFTVVGAGVVDPSTDGVDAQIAIGTSGTPVTVSSSTNTFSAVMAGASFTVNKVDETATVTINSDPDAVAAKIQTLVDAANAAMKFARDYTSNAPGSSAALKGDFSVSSLGGRLMDAVTFAIPNSVPVTPATTPPSFKTGFPADVGFSVSRDGRSVTFDKSKFVTALKADPTLAQRMVGGTATGVGTDGKLGTSDDVAATGIAGRLLAVAKTASDSTTGSLVALAKGQESMVKGYQDRIAAWDVRLEKRKEMLTRQFTAMETALSSLRNQSTWLAGQINSLG